MSAGGDTINGGVSQESTTNTQQQNDTSGTKVMEVLPPNSTLYVSNIDWSLKKNILRRGLLALFERHGKVSCLHLMILILFWNGQ